MSLLSPRSPRYRSLDIWRGVACLVVLAFHACYRPIIADLPAAWAEGPTGVITWACQHMWLGVQIFFVISGYCIAATADSTRRRQGVTWQYFYRRLRRIFPPYWVLLGVTCLAVAAWALLVPGGASAETELLPWNFTFWQWFGSVTLTELWRDHFVGGERKLILGHAWTLCYEEQFYLVVGLILFVAPRWLFTAATVVSVFTLAIKHASYRMGVSIQGFFFDGNWLLFYSGILVYYRINYATPRRAALIYAVLLLMLAYSLRDFLRGVGDPEYFEQRLCIAVVFALALLALHRWDAAMASSPLLAPIDWCGKISYSIYLVHFPVCLLVEWTLTKLGYDVPGLSLYFVIPLCAVVTLPLAWAFYLGVERHFLNPPSTGGQGKKTPPQQAEARVAEGACQSAS